MVKPDRRDLRSVLNSAILEWGSKSRASRERMKKRILKDPKCSQIAAAIALNIGFNINSDEDVRALLYILCLFAFTDLPKGATAKGWDHYEPLIKQAARVARNTPGNKLSSLVANVLGSKKSDDHPAYRQKIKRAYAAATSAFPNMTAKEKKRIAADLSALKKFFEKKDTRKPAAKRGAYNKK